MENIANKFLLSLVTASDGRLQMSDMPKSGLGRCEDYRLEDHPRGVYRICEAGCCIKTSSVEVCLMLGGKVLNMLGHEDCGMAKLAVAYLINPDERARLKGSEVGREIEELAGRAKLKSIAEDTSSTQEQIFETATKAIAFAEATRISSSPVIKAAIEEGKFRVMVFHEYITNGRTPVLLAEINRSGTTVLDAALKKSLTPQRSKSRSF
jgi:hypothetical protein